MNAIWRNSRRQPWVYFSPRVRFYTRRAITSTGVYVVLEGRAKLSVNSAQGKTLVLGFFGPGTILGLAAAILGRTHVVTAEIMKPTKILFVSRKELAKEMQGNVTAARQAAELVSEACYFVLGKIRAVDLSQSAGKSLLAASLDCFPTIRSYSEQAAYKLDLSQEAIAQMVGLSRETVTRLLARLHKRGILNWKRSGLVIRDRNALEKLADLSGTFANPVRSAAIDRNPLAH